MVPHRPYLILLIWPLSLRESSTHYYLMHGGRVGGGGGEKGGNDAQRVTISLP